VQAVVPATVTVLQVQDVRVQLRHTATQQLGATVYTLSTELLAQLLSVAADDAASTACTSKAAPDTAAASATAPVATNAAVSSYSSGSTAPQSAVAQQHVLMKLLVPSDRWQCAATDAVTFISCDGKSSSFIHTQK
jgi:hypothetical protein